MPNGILATLILVLHFGFIVFVIFGALLALRWRWMPVLHLPALAWAVGIEISGSVCPLTPLENALRRSAGEQGYAGGFVEHYLLPIVYPSGLTSDLQWGLAAGLLVLNGVSYGIVSRHRRVETADSDDGGSGNGENEGNDGNEGGSAKTSSTGSGKGNNV